MSTPNFTRASIPLPTPPSCPSDCTRQRVSSGPEGGFQDYVSGTEVSTPNSCTADRCQGALMVRDFAASAAPVHQLDEHTHIPGGRQACARPDWVRLTRFQGREPELVAKAMAYPYAARAYDAWTRAMCFLPA